MTSTSTQKRARFSRKQKERVETGRTTSRIGDKHAATTGYLVDATLDVTAFKYYPRRQPGRCAICGSTRHYMSVYETVKPKAKNAEYEDDSTWQAEAEWQEQAWETEECEASKSKKAKGKRSKLKAKSKGKSTLRSISPRPAQSQTP